MEADLVLARRRKDRRQPAKELARLHQELRLSRVPRLPEAVENPPVLAKREALLREPRPRAVPEQAIAELDGAGNTVSSFVFGSKEQVPDFMTKAGITYRIVSDDLGRRG